MADDQEDIDNQIGIELKLSEGVIVCRTCRSEFSKQGELNRHVKKHERPYKCSKVDCKYHTTGFQYNKDKQRHEEERHPEMLRFPSIMEYVCARYGCFKGSEYKTKRMQNMIRHLKTRHNIYSETEISENIIERETTINYNG
jgi:hypothetical protein